MGSAFAVWMIVILVIVAIAMIILKKNHPQPEPVAPMRQDGGLTSKSDKSEIFIPVQKDLPATDFEA